MKQYAAPQVADLGDIHALTGIFGRMATRDVLIDENGEIVLTGQNSIDACATSSGTVCDVPVNGS